MAALRRRYFVPEVIQTSALDCGPAALKALFGGFGIDLSYGRLREACHTSVDGTSIDTLEELAGQLGLQVEQSMLPTDLMLLESSACLPAIVVVRRPDGANHFVVLWRVQGDWVQVMDPAGGRIWMRRQPFMESLYVHEQAVPRAAWDEWSRSDVFAAGLAQRMTMLGASASEPWADAAHHDAALRLAGTLRRAGRLGRGEDTRELLRLSATHAGQIPAAFWTVRADPDDDDQVLMRGAVLLSASGPAPGWTTDGLPPELAAIVDEAPPRPWAPVWQVLCQDGWHLPALLGAALLVAALGAVIEALLFRGLFDLGRHLGLSGERLVTVAVVLLFLLTLLAVEWPAATGLFRLGRVIEMHLRVRFAMKVPRLGDRYFQSRLISDMAYRAHWLQLLRQLPEIAGQLMRSGAGLLVTVATVTWLYPGVTLWAVFAVLAALIVPMAFMPAMFERDLRVREISASLSRLYLDALQGSAAIQAHGAQRTIRALQAEQLSQWAQAGLRQQALIARADALQLALTTGLVIAMIWRQVTLVPGHTDLLLLAYWAVSIPLTGRQFASLTWSLPGQRNTMLRFLEPLAAPDETVSSAQTKPGSAGVMIDIDDVVVVAGGNKVLDGVSLHIEPGEHVGIVGASGAGKSSLVGLLLGWHVPAQGSVQVDGAPLDAMALAALRRDTAWIDPDVHLFRRTLFDNLLFGSDEQGRSKIGSAIDSSGLGKVLERLPRGLQTSIGDAGARLSGGEGQLVRVARAHVRGGIRLAVLDEPARGMDHEHRREMLARSRARFAGATLLCVTHDVADTLELDRVVVVDGGQIVEQGRPADLRDDPASTYRKLLEIQLEVADDLWRHPAWRRLRMVQGEITETEGARA